MTVPDLSNSLTDSQKINLNIISLNTRVNELLADMNNLNKVVLTGNGDLPLREQVRNNTAYIKEARYWTKFVVGALILQTLAFLFGVVVALVRFLPVLEKLASP